MRTYITPNLRGRKWIPLAVAVLGSIVRGEAGGDIGQPGQALPAFEAASVKPTSPYTTTGRLTGGPGTDSPGQFIATNVTLGLLLLKAYDLKSYQLIGPSLIDRNKYDIFAKIPSGATTANINLMLQKLLAERFGMTVHRERRSLSLYELVVAKGGPKLRERSKALDEAPAGTVAPSPAKNLRVGKEGIPVPLPSARVMMSFPEKGVQRVTARGQTLAELIRLLEREIGRPVVDGTGLAGTYDFDLSYAMRPASGAAPTSSAGSSEPSVQTTVNDPAPALFDALVEQLGLRIASKKGSVEVLVVDKVNKTPTGN
jgi:uncharacterized protein (TIGR03435 family)